MKHWTFYLTAALYFTGYDFTFNIRRTHKVLVFSCKNLSAHKGQHFRNSVKRSCLSLTIRFLKSVPVSLSFSVFLQLIWKDENHQNSSDRETCIYEELPLCSGATLSPKMSWWKYHLYTEMNCWCMKPKFGLQNECHSLNSWSFIVWNSLAAQFNLPHNPISK